MSLESEVRRRLEADPAIQKLLAGLEFGCREAEAKRAVADPAVHKLTRIFAADSNLNYHYVDAGRDGLGRRIRYCYSIHRNVAGFFLSWREVWSRKSAAGKRDQWSARRHRNAARALAQKRAERYQRARATQPAQGAGVVPAPQGADGGSAKTEGWATPLDLSGWARSSPYTLCRGDLETDGQIHFNVQRDEPATRDYPGCPAAVEDLIFVARGAEIELTPAEVKDAEERAWEHLRALDEERDDGG